jgi:hypothetical protein
MGYEAFIQESQDAKTAIDLVRSDQENIIKHLTSHTTSKLKFDGAECLEIMEEVEETRIPVYQQLHSKGTLNVFL